MKLQRIEEASYRRVTVFMIRELCSVHYDVLTSELVVGSMTQVAIAERLGVTCATLSRAATGVTSLAGPYFLRLCRLYHSRLADTVGFKSLFEI